ncbi:MAG: hypothetical protein RBU37_08915 [Myxococcota bacterium]|jgi:hypothetical protein|nr:hypothetical protein [Myxococcota bacterium]
MSRCFSFPVPKLQLLMLFLLCAAAVAYSAHTFFFLREVEAQSGTLAATPWHYFYVMLSLCLGLLIFVALYAYLRFRSRLWLDEQGLRLQRFGFSAQRRRIALAWSQIHRVRLRQIRRGHCLLLFEADDIELRLVLNHALECTAPAQGQTKSRQSANLDPFQHPLYLALRERLGERVQTKL